MPKARAPASISKPQPKQTNALIEDLRKADVKSNGRTEPLKLASRSRSDPLWKGPEVDGVTQSLLGRFLCCRERFRLLVVEGLAPADDFNHRLEYGNLWHTCEEWFAKGGLTVTSSNTGTTTPWQRALGNYSVKLARRYPLQQEQVNHWYNICKLQFPEYIKYWQHHKDVQKRTPLLEETCFRVPYDLPSGRTVLLRGKWDSVDLVTEGKKRAIWLQENKTKGDIDETQLLRQLTFDLQSMFYITALCNDTGIDSLEELRQWDGKKFKVPMAGIRYNVIKRPLSGGKGTIKKKEPTKSNPRGESDAEFYERLRQYIVEEPERFFMRWNVYISTDDIARFKHQFLDPILQQLCDWWDTVKSHDSDPFANARSLHYRYPYGVYNPLNEGKITDLDQYMDEGSVTGLARRETLFPELESEL